MTLKNPRFRYSRNRRYLQITPSPFFRVRLNAAKITLILIALFSLVLFIIDFKRNELTRTLRSMVIDATVPLVSLGQQAKAKLTSDFYNLIDSSHQYAVSLKLKDEEVLSWRLEVQRLQRENIELKQALNYKNFHGFKGITTELIELKALKLQHKALLPVGSNEGVSKNSIIVNNLGLVGKVVEVSAKTSQIIKLEHQLSAVPVYVDRTKDKAVVKGQNKNNFLELSYVNLNELKVGDRLLTSGIAGLYPRGLLVAVVAEVNNKLILQPVYKASNERFIYVLRAVATGS